MDTFDMFVTALGSFLMARNESASFRRSVPWHSANSHSP